MLPKQAGPNSTPTHSHQRRLIVITASLVHFTTFLPDAGFSLQPINEKCYQFYYCSMLPVDLHLAKHGLSFKGAIPVSYENS
jgi:hypothetical protein